MRMSFPHCSPLEFPIPIEESEACATELHFSLKNHANWQKQPQHIHLTFFVNIEKHGAERAQTKSNTAYMEHFSFSPKVPVEPQHTQTQTNTHRGYILSSPTANQMFSLFGTLPLPPLPTQQLNPSPKPKTSYPLGEFFDVVLGRLHHHFYRQNKTNQHNKTDKALINRQSTGPLFRQDF